MHIVCTSKIVLIERYILNAHIWDVGIGWKLAMNRLKFKHQRDRRQFHDTYIQIKKRVFQN